MLSNHGYSASDQQNKGVLAALGEYPNVNVVGQLAHNWTSQVAQKELSQWLSTNTKKVDGIAVQSSGETGTLHAKFQFLQMIEQQYHQLFSY